MLLRAPIHGLRQGAAEIRRRWPLLWSGVLFDVALVLVLVNLLIIAIYWSAGTERVLLEMAISSGIASVVGAPVATHRRLQQARIQQLADELRAIADTDSLTGLGNRRAMFKRLDVLAQPDRAAFVVFDIDHFKRINDTFGHAGGDAAIKAFAELVRRNLAGDAFAARLGGEEFGVLLPGMPVDAAEHLASAVVSQARRLVVRAPNGLPITMTVSAGLASGIPQAERLLLCADEALYLAKRDGRDRVRAAA
jgi:diguanylate cyclase (GGDEF)-like protein